MRSEIEMPHHRKDLSLSHFFDNEWCADHIQGKLLKKMAPVYMRASQEGRTSEFLQLFQHIWNDQFSPVIDWQHWEHTIHRQMSRIYLYPHNIKLNL